MTYRPLVPLFVLLTTAWSLARGLDLVGFAGGFHSALRMTQDTCAILCAAVWLLLTVLHQCQGAASRRTVSLTVGLAVIPAVSVAAVWTSGAYHLYYAAGSPPAAFALPGPRGPLMLPIMLYSWATIVAALAMSVSWAVGSLGLHRRLAAMHAVASALILFGTASYGLGLVGNDVGSTVAFVCALFVAVVLQAVIGRRASATPVVPRSAVYTGMEDPMMVLDPSHHIVDVNGAARRLFWGDAHTVLNGRHIHELLPSGARSVVLDTSDGRRRFAVRIKEVRSSNGDTKGFVVALHETSDNIAAARGSEGGIEALLAATQDSAWEWHLESGEFRLSHHLYATLGYSEGSIPSTLWGWRQLVHSEDLASLDLTVHDIRSGGVASMQRDFRVRDIGGQWHWVTVRGRVVAWLEDGRPAKVIGVHSDAGERRHADELTTYRAMYDELTGLPNRFLLLDRLGLELARSLRQQSEFALAFCDLNDFKAVNDQYGHAVGDELLRQVAARLSACVRETDTVGRMGGDEFVLIFGGRAGAASDVRVVAERVMKAMREPFTVVGTTIAASMSMGIAVWPDHGRDAEALMRAADSAMYAAKSKNKNRYLYFTPAHVDPEERSGRHARSQQVIPLNRR